MIGQNNQQVSSYKHDEHKFYGIGKDLGDIYWKSLMRQAILDNFLYKDVDHYGLLRLTEKGNLFLENPYGLKFLMNQPMETAESLSEEASQQGNPMDSELFTMLNDLRKKIAKQKKLPKFVIFQDPSLEEMCIHYPITLDELKQIQGVGAGKAMKFGSQFVSLIKKYVEENEIERPQDLIIKSTANRSALKVSIIQNVDKKIGLEDIAFSKGLTYEEILREVESIVNSGTRLNLDYFIDEMIEEDRQDEVYDYFLEAEEDSIDTALNELGNDEYTFEEIQLMRIKFMSELGN
jgi:ATP-dependent DNA helicase RecQ